MRNKTKGTKFKNKVNSAWKYFWQKRGYSQPFEVSKTHIGAFDMPSNIKSWSQ